ncbi:sigma-70 family RNA polymerase sigma factor [Bacillus salacetis]|uniref:Sigma-70 family RNA polymerase sigma factor n=1 Tax=Bacillus salacetis TaxID=2315464 RepID=A0A3A1RC57_9BACI|nr:sigma-70 family RNA polymerase sigma factor [Bacillus salacetis]RIW38513.1 sigma-70 family RNA polymerase sigma factor [Bacillus salacetis]
MNAKLGKTHDAADQIMKVYPQLRSYCWNLTGDKWDGEDLAQETIYKVLNSYKETNQKLNSALLYTIARNNWIDTVRKRARESLSDKVQKEESREMSSSSDISYLIENILKNFTLQQTVIFLLKDVFHYNYKEISEELSLSEGAVKASLFRMRTRLKTGRLDGNAEIATGWIDGIASGIIKEEAKEVIEILTASSNAWPVSVNSSYASELFPREGRSSLQNPVLAA